MFWSKLCKWSWKCAWNLAFPVFISPIVWNMCENLPYESVYFKELHNKQECYWPTIYRAGAAVMSTVTRLSLVREDAMIVAATCICSVWRIAQNSWDMSPWNKHHYFRFYKLGVGKVINWLNLYCTPLTTVPCNILRYFVLITKLVLRRFLVFL